MILVRNLQPRLSGSNLYGIALLLLIAAASCTPRAKVLNPGAKSDEREAPVVVTEKEKKVEEAVAVAETRQIALLLPFQLNQSTGTNPGEADVRRAALALDFYQGFEIGLHRLAGQGANFRLEVIDSRDDEQVVAKVARLDAVQEANLVVGPIFPKGIKAFAAGAGLNKEQVLQVSPLAATMPTEFNLPNLVSITSPIMTHAQALARHLVEAYTAGDVILLYRTDETSSQQFLPSLKNELNTLNPKIPVHEIDSEERLLERLRTSGNNLVVCGSTNRFRIVTIVNQLLTQMDQSGFRIQLFGHPGWARTQFTIDEGLERLQTVISSSYFIDRNSSSVRSFEREYRSAFGVAPTEFAFKGYDAGYYFGKLLTKYGNSYRRHLLDTEYNGLHNSFDFQYDPQWGYVNAAIHFLQFQNGVFTR